MTAGQAAPDQALLLCQRSSSWQHGSLLQPYQCQRTTLWPSIAPAGSVLHINVVDVLGRTPFAQQTQEAARASQPTAQPATLRAGWQYQAQPSAVPSDRSCQCSLGLPGRIADAGPDAAPGTGANADVRSLRNTVFYFRVCASRKSSSLQQQVAHDSCSAGHPALLTTNGCQSTSAEAQQGYLDPKLVSPAACMPVAQKGSRRVRSGIALTCRRPSQLASCNILLDGSGGNVACWQKCHTMRLR